MTSREFTLREGRLSDLESIVALDRASDTAPHWPLSAYSNIVASEDTQFPQRCLIVAKHARANTTHIAGFAVAALHRTPQDISAELEDIIVAEHLRRKGIGRALCKAIIEWAQTHGATSISLEVRAASAGAIALYTTLGFHQSGRRPRYYSNPVDDAIQMHLACGPGTHTAPPAAGHATVTSPPDPSSSPA